MNRKTIHRNLGRSRLAVTSFTANRAHVVGNDSKSYLIHFLEWDRLTTPGHVRRRVKKWSAHANQRIESHIILANGPASPTLPQAFTAERSWACLITGLGKGPPQVFLKPTATPAVLDILRVIRIPDVPIPRSRRRDASQRKSIQEPIASIREHPFIPPSVGTKIDDYVLERFLGSGKTSSVYSATVVRDLPEIGLQRAQHVALKFYNLWILTQAFQFERIGRELMAMSRISSPSVVRVHDLRISPLRAHRSYMVMELVQGSNLFAAIASSKSFDFDRALEYTQQLFAGLASLHSAGVLHRDIKPENLMLSSDGVLKIMDFGVVKPTDSERDLTGTTQFLGTIRYAAPEYLLGQECTARSDIYSAAAVGFFMLYGEEIVPKNLHFAKQVLSVTTGDVKFPSSSRVRNDTSEGLSDILRRCLEKDPSLRPSSADEVRDQLDNL